MTHPDHTGRSKTGERFLLFFLLAGLLPVLPALGHPAPGSKGAPGPSQAVLHGATRARDYAVIEPRPVQALLLAGEIQRSRKGTGHAPIGSDVKKDGDGAGVSRITAVRSVLAGVFLYAVLHVYRL